MTALYPLRFRPVFRPYVWGGRRLETVLGKPIEPGDHWAECWEICDHGPDQTVVASGPLTGMTLGELIADHGPALLGRHHPLSRFPLLVKFLDAAQRTSLQVHPDDARAATRIPPDLGKTEAWVVMAAEPGARIYAGLCEGMDRRRLAEALKSGRWESCLHSISPRPGDCIFLPAGTLHALGDGLLVAEVQQASDATYRLFDWGRLGADGLPRPLHVEEGLEAVDYRRGPVEPQEPRPTGRPGVSRLVDCEQFVLDRWQLERQQTAGGDQRCHILIVLEGRLQAAGDPIETPLVRGEVVLLPASLGEVEITPTGRTVFLDAFLP